MRNPKIWNTIKYLGGSPRSTGASNYAIIHNGKELHRGNAFVAHYVDVSCLYVTSEERRSVNLRDRCLCSPSVDRPTVTVSELSADIAAAKSKGRLDLIKSALASSRTFAQDCTYYCHTQTQQTYRSDQVLRPVSITSCVTKVSDRLKCSLTDDQYSTEDQVLGLCVVRSVTGGSQHKTPHPTVLALIDFSRAFDAV